MQGFRLREMDRIRIPVFWIGQGYGLGPQANAEAPTEMATDLVMEQSLALPTMPEPGLPVQTEVIPTILDNLSPATMGT